MSTRLSRGTDRSWSGAAISITGRIDKVRERRGRFLVTFSAEVDTAAGDRLLDAVATFLMGQGTAPDGTDDAGEPAVWHRELNELPAVRPRPDIGEPFAPLLKSRESSRSGEVRRSFR